MRRRRPRLYSVRHSQPRPCQWGTGLPTGLLRCRLVCRSRPRLPVRHCSWAVQIRRRRSLLSGWCGRPRPSLRRWRCRLLHEDHQPRAAGRHRPWLENVWSARRPRAQCNSPARRSQRAVVPGEQRVASAACTANVRNVVFLTRFCWSRPRAALSRTRRAAPAMGRLNRAMTGPARIVGHAVPCHLSPATCPLPPAACPLPLVTLFAAAGS